MPRPPSTPARLALFAGLMSLLALPVSAQHEGHEPEREIFGVVRASDTGAPLAGVTVVIVGGSARDISHGDGVFHLLGIAPGRYTLRASRVGYRTEEIEVNTEAGVAEVEITLSPSAVELPGLVVTGSITERQADRAVQTVGVLTGEELQRRLNGTLAETIATEPGVAVSAMGPAAARPVLRGLAGDRVLVLEDGNMVGDVQNSGADHAVALDPTSARRIEIVRGASSILYGSSALGGVVNVIRDEIPTSIPDHMTGTVTVQGNTVNDGAGTTAHTRLALSENVPLRIEAGYRTSDDLATPVGPLENTGAESWNASIGTAWVDDWGHAGVSARVYRNEYGLPGGFVGGHVQGVSTDLERAALRGSVLVRGDAEGWMRSLEFDAQFTDYEHIETETGGIFGTLFGRQTGVLDALMRTGAWGPFTSGAWGTRLSTEFFEFGGSLFNPNTRRHSFAAFGVQEIELGALRVETGLRWDGVLVDPLDEDPDSDIGVIEDKRFGSFSGSLGAIWEVGGGASIGANLARGFRTPDINELFSEGPHLAAFAFEVGNPSLGVERSTGIDLFARLGRERLNAEFTVFRNDIQGYVFPRATGRISRVQLPIYQFVGEDADFVGVESQVEWAPGGALRLDATASWVRGTIASTDEPLPWMPPLQGTVGVAWEPSSGFLRAQTRFADRQDRLGEFEEPTAGFTVFDLSGGVRLTVSGRLHIITASIRNLTDQTYRNHLSRVKEIMPEAGRGFDITYRVVY